MGLWQDDDVKRQVLAVASIAFLMGTFELIFFLWVVVPTVRSGMQSLLQGVVSVTPPPLVRHLARAGLGVLKEREQELIDRNNATARVNGVLIALAPLVLVVLLLVMYPTLRREGRRHVILDVLMVFACLAAFQVMFFFLGRRYHYSTTPEMLSDLVDRYNASCDHAATRATPPSPLSIAEKVTLMETVASMVPEGMGMASGSSSSSGGGLGVGQLANMLSEDERNALLAAVIKRVA